MRAYTDEANLHARIYAMRSRLMSFSDYVSLIRQPGGGGDRQASGASDPVAAEESVFREQIAGIMPLVEASPRYAPLFLAFLRQFEALNAKAVLAKAFGLTSLEQWHDIGPYAILDRGLLDAGTSLQDIRLRLAGTYLADVFADAENYEQMAARVDLCAAGHFHAASASFTREAKRDFREFMGRRIAVTAAILSLRLRKTYRWEDERIRLFMERLQDTFGGKTRPQMKAVQEALGAHLDQLRASGAPEPSVAECEHYLEQDDYRWISSVFHRDFHSGFCVAAYLWLLYYQIRNLFKIIEGRRFGFSPERIIGMMVCRTGG